LDNRPIGIFDSGLGGLTAVKEVMGIMPWEDIVYFGDTGRVPYGTRAKETIIKYSVQDFNFLITNNIKHVIVACGTVSSVALSELKKRFDIPVTGVVEAAASAAVNATKNRRIGIIGTPATIESDSYRRVIEAHCADFRLFSKACPLFVPIVEHGRTSPDDIIVKTLVSEYLENIKKAEVDVLILGCTHYPILKEAIAAYMPGVTLIDPGAEAARQVASELEKHGLDAEHTRKGHIEFYVSETTDRFAASAEKFLRLSKDCDANQIDIERY